MQTIPYSPLPVRPPLIDTAVKRLMTGNTAFRAIFNGIPAPALVEMAGYAGFDLLIIDNEHGSGDLQSTEHQLRAALAVGLPAIVRCLEHDIPRVLDMGAQGVQIPMVRDAAHARALVDRISYPLTPGESGTAGTRGSAFSTRAAGYGAHGGNAHTQRSREGICLVVMIETPEAAENAAEIAAIPGVDAVFVGPNDLAHSMGHGADWRHPAVQSTIERVLRQVSSQGSCAGVLALSAQDEERAHQWGARFFSTVSTALITQAFAQAAKAGRTDALTGLTY